MLSISQFLKIYEISFLSLNTYAILALEDVIMYVVLISRLMFALMFVAHYAQIIESKFYHVF